MSSYLDTAVEIAREAGALISRFYERRIGFELKGESDLVTEADRASEILIVERLSTHFPSHGIVGEEGTCKAGTSDFRWFVDPLDGTTNFAHGFPVFNVSIGLQQGDEMVAGVVYDPTRDEMFAAERGSGAHLNNRRIQVSKAKTLSASLVATGFPSYNRHKNVNIHFYHQLAMATHGVRRAGSAALDLAYVACGRLEAYWEIGLKPWDMAAGSLLVTEAGGTVTKMDGQRWELRGPNVLSNNTAIHEEMISFFAEISSGNFRYPMPQI